MREPGFIKRSPRIDARFEATLVAADGGEAVVIVTDISSAGVRLETEGPLPIGARFGLRLAKLGEVPMQVRWSLGNEAGGAFLEPVDFADF
jgi:hypothetical protein